jgi:CO/xanthine dehydrogenase FAD-binding subunit
VTLACAVLEDGSVRLAFGSVGPRPLLRVDDSGVLADRAALPEAWTAVLEPFLAAATPSARSMRASPEYRRAMLRVLAVRALEVANGRLAGGVTP